MRPFATKIFIIHGKIMFTKYLYCILAMSESLFIGLSIFSDCISFNHDIKYKSAKLLYNLYHISYDISKEKNNFYRNSLLNNRDDISLHLHSKTSESKRYINKIKRMKRGY